MTPSFGPLARWRHRASVWLLALVALAGVMVASPASATLVSFQLQAVNLTTNGPLPGASVTVYNYGTTTRATIYNLSGSPISNPMIADTNGLIAFQADSSLGYQVVWSSAGYVSPVFAVGSLSAVSATTANTWAATQTFAAPPIFTTLTGYVYCNGVSACTASTGLGTPASIVLTNGTGLPIGTGVSGLGAGVGTALALAPNAAGAFVAPSNAQAQDNVLMGGASVPIFVAVPNCSNALNYSTSTHLWTCNSLTGTGTVTSVTVAPPAILTASGCTITSSGTCTLGLATQAANTAWRGPVSGSAAAPTFRAAVCADLPAGARCLLNTLTASASASLSDTTSLTSTYAHYDIVFTNLIPTTNAVTCEILLHSGGTFQTTGYGGYVYIFNASVTAFTHSTYIPCTYDSYWATGGQGMSGTVHIDAPSQTAVMKSVLPSLGGPAASGGSQYIGGIAWFNTNTTAIDGFEVIPSGGTIASGTVQVYGWN